MTRRVILIGMLIAVGAIGLRIATNSDPPAERLPRGVDTAYELSITRFSHGEGLTCPPFRLDMKFDRDPDLVRTVFTAEQGEDIQVVQTPTTVFVFYKSLVLHDFGGWVEDGRDAKPLLCNSDIPVCAAEMRRLAAARLQGHRICEPEKRW